MAEKKTIWSVGGGKGGIGKSITAANIGCALAQKGSEVMLIDADLGGANLHTYFGIKYPPRGLDDFMKGRFAKLDEAAIETQVSGLSLISGAGEFLGIANPAYSQKQRLINAIKNLKARYIIVDLGAGSSYNVLDFFAVSNEGIVVLVPEPAAVQNAYVFLKSFVYRRLMRLFSDNAEVCAMIREGTDIRGKNCVKTFSDLCERIAAGDRQAAGAALEEIKSYRPKLILNMSSNPEDIKVVEAFRAACKTFLSLETEFIGVLRSSAQVKASARKMRPFMLDEPAADAHRDMDTIIAALSGGAAKDAPPEAAREDAKEGQDVFGFNDNVSHMGTVFHVQTEVQGGPNPVIESIIYNGGRIFFSKKTLWNDTPEKKGNALGLRDFASKQHRIAMAAIKANKIRLQG